MIRHRTEAGIALPLVLGTILLLALIVLAAIAAIQGPANMLGRLASRDEARTAAESHLERARAILISDPAYDLDRLGVAAQWSTTDSCLLAVSTTEGDITIHESWIVTAPTRFTVFADSGVMLSPESRIDGLIHRGGPGNLCDTSPIDTTPFIPLITRRITAATIGGLRVTREFVEITPEDSTVTLSNIEIDHGTILVKGDAILSGTFSGAAADNRPLLIVTGNLASAAHESSWQWTGAIAVTKDAFLAGPVDFTGTFAARSVETFGGVTAKPGLSRPPLGMAPRVERVSHRESAD